MRHLLAGLGRAVYVVIEPFIALMAYFFEILYELLFPKPVFRPARSVTLTARLSDGTIYSGENPMSISIRKSQEIVFTPEFRDEDGNLTMDLGSKPVWSSSNEEVLTLSVSEDGLSAIATPTGVVGHANVALLVDADPGEAEVALTGVAEVDVRPGLAVTVTMNPAIRAREQAEAPAPVEPPAPAPEEGNGDGGDDGAGETPAEEPSGDDVPPQETPEGGDTGTAEGGDPTDPVTQP